MKNIIINHPNGQCTLEKIQNEVLVWKRMKGEHDLGFKASEVQALIDKIYDLNAENIIIINLSRKIVEENLDLKAKVLHLNKQVEHWSKSK